jgi:signal transduction histidine kinase
VDDGEAQARPAASGREVGLEEPRQILPRDAVAGVGDLRDEQAARGLLIAEVADTGHGIARHDFARLFQPYFSTRGSTRGRGTGLGLAIVHRIMTEHGGRIRAESNRPGGARMIIELPVADDAHQRAQA